MSAGRYRPREVPVVRCADCAHGWELCELCMAARPVPLHWMGEGRCMGYEPRPAHAAHAGRPHSGRAGKH